MVEVGDDLKKAAKFTDAAKAYDEASRLAGLAGKAPAVNALGARARLYSALSLQEAGDPKASAAVAADADDVSAPETLRGFAMLTLANIAIAKGDAATASKWLNTMDSACKPATCERATRKCSCSPSPRSSRRPRRLQPPSNQHGRPSAAAISPPAG
ncbi:MAG: hypothetical protein EXS38_09925 [Opitutus sp.]|nr:hypothetical protein [Opitutus sp.]